MKKYILVLTFLALPYSQIQASWWKDTVYSTVRDKWHFAPIAVFLGGTFIVMRHGHRCLTDPNYLPLALRSQTFNEWWAWADLMSEAVLGSLMGLDYYYLAMNSHFFSARRAALATFRSQRGWPADDGTLDSFRTRKALGR